MFGISWHQSDRFVLWCHFWFNWFAKTKRKQLRNWYENWDGENAQGQSGQEIHPMISRTLTASNPMKITNEGPLSWDFSVEWICSPCCSFFVSFFFFDVQYTIDQSKFASEVCTSFAHIQFYLEINQTNKFHSKNDSETVWMLTPTRRLTISVYFSSKFCFFRCCFFFVVILRGETASTKTK